MPWNEWTRTSFNEEERHLKWYSTMWKMIQRRVRERKDVNDNIQKKKSYSEKWKLKNTTTDKELKISITETNEM